MVWKLHQELSREKRDYTKGKNHNPFSAMDNNRNFSRICGGYSCTKTDSGHNRYWCLHTCPIYPNFEVMKEMLAIEASVVTITWWRRGMPQLYRTQIILHNLKEQRALALVFN